MATGIPENFCYESESQCRKTDTLTFKKRGLRRYGLEASTSYGNKQEQDSSHSDSDKVIERSLVKKCSRSGKICSNCFKGKKVLLQAGEVEQLMEWFKILEEENKIMNEALMKGLKERKDLMNEIYQKFQIIERHLGARNQERSREASLIFRPPEDRRLGTGLSLILLQDSNPSLVTRDLKAMKL